MADYTAKKLQCEKVIIVTHSMAGLTARALVHPDYGNLKDKVLGIVHGVMPAIGAPAGYRRMRAGFEDAWNDPAADVLGDEGDEVTVVLANAPGGLELLPSEAYGNGWLKITHQGKTLKALPERGDPYTEIYSLKNKWYGLLKEEWINPAELKKEKAGFNNTLKLLEKAKAFHRAIANTYHDLTYAHYGADRERRAFGNVVWEIEHHARFGNNIFDEFYITGDDKQGEIRLQYRMQTKLQLQTRRPDPPFKVRILPPAEAGDQTVPIQSADHQLQSGQCKGVFRQTGYEHQGSYKDNNVLAASLYSIAKIALNMKWSDKA